VAEYEDELTIRTPEGVDVRLTLAGVGSRFVSALVDAAIQWSSIGAVAALVFLTNGFGAGPGIAVAIFSVAFFALFWGYDVFFEVLASGRTPGKRWNGLRVVRSSGHPIGFLASAARNLLRLVDWLPSAYLVGAAVILATKQNQRLGDLVADTIVVRESRASQQAPLAVVSAGSPDLPPQLAAWDTSAVTIEEIAAVRSFLERRSEIDLTARNELGRTLARRLRPKVAGVPDDVYGEAFLEALVAAKSARR
jgi:uncharacterized RDD family membrane protein YckC